jgi:hypothetical protein
MRTAVPQQRQDHDISLYGAAAVALLLAALTALPPQPAAAQAAVPCTAIDSDAERLACYDRALRGAAAPAVTPPPTAQAPARSAAPAATPAERATPSAPGNEPRRERRVRESAAPAPSAPSAASDAGDAETRTVVIVGMRGLPGRETTFTTDDGTSWVQTDSQRVTGMPEPPFDAEIKPGAMGSYFLIAKDRARAIRVRALRE